MNLTINTCIKNLIFFCLCSNCVHTTCAQNMFNLIKQHNHKSLKKLFKHNKNNNFIDDSGIFCLIHSVKSRNLYALKLLLKQKNIDLNYTDALGKTALDYALELEGVNDESALSLQHMQYDMCILLVNNGGKVTSVERDLKLRSFLLKGKPKHDTTLLGFCVNNSSAFVSAAAACKMGFLGSFLSVVTNFLGSFVVYSIYSISHYRRFKKYNHSFILE